MSGRRGGRGRNTKESALDTMTTRMPITHAKGNLFYQVLPTSDALLQPANVTLKACLKLVDLKAIVNSQNKEGRNYEQFRTIVLCSQDQSVLGAACVKCHKTEHCGAMEVLAFGIDPNCRKQGYGTLLAGALKQTSKALDLECVICSYFNADATKFWECMGFTKDALSSEEQRLFTDAFVNYPGTSKMKFTVEGKANYLKEAKSKTIDSVVATIQSLMDLQRQVFKQQLREMHRIKDRQNGTSGNKKRKRD